MLPYTGNLFSENFRVHGTVVEAVKILSWQCFNFIAIHAVQLQNLMTHGLILTVHCANRQIKVTTFPKIITIYTTVLTWNYNSKAVLEHRLL